MNAMKDEEDHNFVVVVVRKARVSKFDRRVRIGFDRNATSPRLPRSPLLRGGVDGHTCLRLFGPG